MIPKQVVDQIINTAQIEEVVEDFVNLKRAGRNLKGVCPFHDEKTPSFVVSPNLNIYKCFGCQRAGNSVNFIMEHEKVSYPEALRYLARKYNIELQEKELSQEELQNLQKIDSFYIINKFAATFYQNQLFQTNLGKSVGLTYFKKRGLNQKTLEKFLIGYSPSSGTLLKDALKVKGYNLDYSQEVGLLNQQRKDFFKERVIFPIQNVSGKIVAFAGRTLKSDKRIPKYINSPESTIYEKRKLLYGLFQSKNEIRRENQCIVVEGYTDVMSLHQNAIENVVATSGTALTPDQARLIKRFTDNVLVLFDGDSAGMSAAMRGLRILLEQNLNVEVVSLPPGEDPDSFVQTHGKGGTIAFLEEQKKDFILFQLDALLKETEDNPLRKAQAIKTIVESLAHIPDNLVRDSYAQYISQSLKVKEEILYEELSKALKELGIQQKRKDLRKFKEEKRWEKEKPKRNQAKTVAGDFREHELIRLLLQHGDKIMQIENEEIRIADYTIHIVESSPVEFSNPTLKEIYQLYVDTLTQETIPDNKLFLQHAKSEIQKIAIEYLNDVSDYSKNWEEKLNSPLRTQKYPEENFEKDAFIVLHNYKQKQIEKLIEENKVKLSTYIDNKDDEGIERCFEIQQKLITIRKEIVEQLNRVVL